MIDCLRPYGVAARAKAYVYQRGESGGRGWGRRPLQDPQEARWHPRPDVIFWQSKPVISGITLYSCRLRPHGHIYSRRCNSCWESLQRNNDSSLKSCRNICRGYLITNGGFWFLGRRQPASPLNFRWYVLTAPFAISSIITRKKTILPKYLFR